MLNIHQVRLERGRYTKSVLQQQFDSLKLKHRIRKQSLEKMSSQYFIIKGHQSGKVLDASMSNVGEVVLWEYNGGDNQLWFWDGRERDVLRNKKFPNKVLDFHWMDFQARAWGKVYLHEFNNGFNQKWYFRGNELVCKGFQNRSHHDLRLDVHSSGTNNGAKVGVYKRNGQSNQKWNLQAVAPGRMDRRYFTIKGGQSGKVLDASLSNVGEVVLWEYNGGDNQLWYWDGQDRDVLRNKKFPNKVLDFHWGDFQKQNWGKVYLFDFNGGWNQKWQHDGRELVCKGYQTRMVHNLRLDVYQNGTHNGAKVGVYQRTGNGNQIWHLSENGTSEPPKKPPQRPSHPSPIHHGDQEPIFILGRNCNGCKNEILTYRFKCTICPDYYLCKFCHQRAHKEHRLVRSDLTGSGEAPQGKRYEYQDSGLKIYSFLPEDTSPFEIAEPLWIPDERFSECMDCKATFTFFKRRHHCRRCGRLLCGDCTSQKERLRRMAFASKVKVCVTCAQFCQYDEIFYVQHLPILMKNTSIFVTVLRVPVASGFQPPPYSPHDPQPAFNPYFQGNQGYPPPYGAGGFKPGVVPQGPSNPILFLCSLSANEKILMFKPDSSGPYNYVEPINPLELSKILNRAPIMDDRQNVVSLSLKFRELKATGEENVEIILSVPQEPNRKLAAVQWLNALNMGLNMLFNKK